MKKNNKVNNNDTNFFEELEKEEQQKAEVELSCLLLDLQARELNVKKMKAEIRHMISETAKNRISLANEKLRGSMEQLALERDTRHIENVKTKLYFLIEALTDNIMDRDNTYLGSEPIYKPLLENENRKIVINKLMQLIKEL